MDDSYTRLLEEAQHYSIAYLKNLATRPIAPEADALQALAIFNEPLPQGGTEARAVLELLHATGSPATVAQTSGRYFGFVIGGLFPIAHAASWLTDTWNQNTALAAMSPIVSVLEDVCERWLVELLHLPDKTAMGVVTGSANATLCALAAARNTLCLRLGYDLQKHGFRNAPPLRVVISEEAHATVFSGLSLVGFGEEDIIKVPTDAYGRIRLDALPRLDDHTLVIVQAGNVNGGHYDPIEAICAQAKQAGAWVHVDGAFGLWAAASRAQRHLVQGVENADSWALDAHKTLNVGYDCGLVFCRDKAALTQAMQANAAYLVYGSQRDGMCYTTEMSRRARAVPLWAVLKCLGAQGIETFIDQLCAHARYFAQRLEQSGFELVAPVCFNQFMVACASETQTQAVLEAIQAGGQCWCSKSRWKQRLIIRISVCSHRTTKEDIDVSIEAFQKALRAVSH